MLHITNGDCTKPGLERSGVAGHILAWRDILHEGPTPAGLSLAQMSTMRAHFLADFLGVPFAVILSDFTQRDATLAQFHMHEEVILWAVKRVDDGAFSLPMPLGHAETFLAQSLALTEAGQAILAERADWIALCGGIDRCGGGVHLSGQNTLWRWDKQHKALYRC